MKPDIEKLNIEEIETLILSHCNVKKKRDKADEKLEDYLYERRSKMNKNFEWTPENIDKLLALNQKFMSCFENMIEEAKPIVKALQKRRDEKDAFLHDFEIEINIKPFILVPNEDGKLCEPASGIEQILIDSLPRYIINLNPKDYIIKDNLNKNIHFSKDLSWNIESLKGISDDHYICYAIHELCDHTCWSIPDVLRINHLWSEVRVRYQNLEDVYSHF